jgi:hypothetical protein
MKLPVLFQRLEGIAITVGALYLYGYWEGNWLLFVPIWLAIDVSMAGYLAGPKIGAYVYNIGHTLVVPILLLAIGTICDNAALGLLSMIWFTHIGIDRALGYGLKETSDFKHTHLGTIGKP